VEPIFSVVLCDGVGINCAVHEN